MEGGPEDESIRRGAARAATWLMRQQAPNGAWPATTLPAGLKPSDAIPRIVRLDQPETRDATLAVILANEVLNDAATRKAVEKSADRLMRMRIEGSKTAKGLWRGVYDLDGSPSDKLPGRENSVDVLASRYAIETLMHVYLALGDEAALNAAQTAAESLRGLRSNTGRWRRVYRLTGNEIADDDLRSDSSGNVFGNNQPVEDDLSAVGDFGMGRVLQKMESLQRQGRKAFLSIKPGRLTEHEILALTACGIAEPLITGNVDALTEKLPRPSDSTGGAAGQVPRIEIDVPRRVQRIAALLALLRAEQPSR
jgi:hypothetical protein